MSRSLLVMFAVGVSAPLASAGVYSPDDPCPFVIKPDGTAEPLPLKQFQILYADSFAGLVTIDPINPGTFDWYQAENGQSWRVGPAGRFAQRLAARWPNRDELSSSDLAGYTADLLRLGGTAQAIQRLQPELRSRRPNYLLLANLAHAYATANDWDTALVRFSDVIDSNPPTALPGTSAEQLKWQSGVDRKYYRQWIRLRKEEAVKKPPVEKQEPDAMFTIADGKPIRFWESEVEATKLPPDALAVAQQLALWAPGDVKLLWLVAELYLAKGDVRAADAVFYQCSNARKFGGPVLFRDHAATARDAVAKLPPPTEVPLSLPDEPPKGEPVEAVDSRLFVIVSIVFGLVAVWLFIVYVVRILVRRLARR